MKNSKFYKYLIFFCKMLNPKINEKYEGNSSIVITTIPSGDNMGLLYGAHIYFRPKISEEEIRVSDPLSAINNLSVILIYQGVKVSLTFPIIKRALELIEEKGENKIDLTTLLA